MLIQNPITCNAGGIWDLFALTDVPTYTESCAPVEEQLLLALCGGLGGPRTHYAVHWCDIHGLPICILVDSGSTTSFISQRVVDQLPRLQLQPTHHQVHIANGGLMVCSAMVPDCSWSMACYYFQHPVKDHPLKCYDLILGMDWLIRFSPIKVDWQQ